MVEPVLGKHVGRHEIVRFTDATFESWCAVYCVCTWYLAPPSDRRERLKSRSVCVRHRFGM